MTTVWVAHVPLSELSALGKMRLHDGVEAMAMGDAVYVRGQCESARLPAEVRALPGDIYTALEDEQLVRYLHQTPTSRLPVGYWAPLREFLSVSLPQACLDAERPMRVPLKMERTTSVRPCNLLLTSVDTWLAYIEIAPLIRLQPLRFVASSQGDVLVHGYPLPPLPGQLWVEESGVAAPAGWSWSPPLDADVVAAAYMLQAGDLTLLHPVESGEAPRIEHLDDNMFAPAHRSAVRGLKAMPGPDEKPDESTEAP